MISIVIPAYNKAKQLPRLLDSIINSKCFNENDIEVIISDDGSSDNTQEVVQKYLGYKNIIYIKKENGGVHQARNRGMEIATKEYIGFIDADDYFLEDGICKIISKVKRHLKYDLIRFYYIDIINKEKTGYKKSGFYTLDDLFYKQLFKKTKNGFSVFRKDIIIRYNLKWLYTNLDSYFWRLYIFFSKSQGILVLDDIVGVYDTTTSGSLSKKRKDINFIKKHSDNKIIYTLKFINLMKDYFKLHPDIVCIYLWNVKNEIIFAKHRSLFLKIIFKIAKKCRCYKLFFLKFIPRKLMEYKLKLIWKYYEIRK